MYVKAQVQWNQGVHLPSQSLVDVVPNVQILTSAVAQWELEISFSLAPGTAQVGFDIFHQNIRSCNTIVRALTILSVCPQNPRAELAFIDALQQAARSQLTEWGYTDIVSSSHQAHRVG